MNVSDRTRFDNTKSFENNCICWKWVLSLTDNNGLGHREGVVSRMINAIDHRQSDGTALGRKFWELVGFVGVPITRCDSKRARSPSHGRCQEHFVHSISFEAALAANSLSERGAMPWHVDSFADDGPDH